MNKSKRIFDFISSLLGLTLLFPFMLFIAFLIKLEDGGPVFYRQKRVGYNGKEFYILKFRTMVVDADKKGIPLTIGRDSRITKIGYWLRKLRIDEIPQLINVLKGEMSLVGPRPEVPQYIVFYSQEMIKILNYKPGMTDPASLSFLDESNLLSGSDNPEEKYVKEILPKKISLSLIYLEKATLCTDILLIIKTFFRILDFKKIVYKYKKIFLGKNSSS